MTLESQSGSMLANRSKVDDALQPTSLSSDHSQELWSRAAQLLSVEDQKRIDFAHPGSVVNVNNILKTAEAKKQLCLDNRWHITRKGKTIFFRDLFQKIVDSIKKVQNALDFVVSLDVSGHAALPWAGVKFFLELAINDNEEFGRVLEGMELITGVISYYAIFEGIYLRKSSESTQHLTESLAKTYSKVLEYLSKARQYYDHHTATRMLKGVLKLDSFDAIAGDIERGRADIDHWARLIDAEQARDLGHGVDSVLSDNHALKEILISWEMPMETISTQVAALYDSLESSKRQQIKEWVSTVPYKQHHENASKNRLSASGLWLLSDETFMQWRMSARSSMCWLHGISGSGKTVLSSVVIDYLLNDTGLKRDGEPVAYFYCVRSSAEPQRADPAELLRSLVLQLSCRKPDTLPKQVVEKYNELQEVGLGARKMSLEESTKLIVQLTEPYTSVAIVIDGLDECEPSAIPDIFGKLNEILESSPSVIKVFLVSRNDRNIACWLEDAPNISINASDNARDIDRFVRHEVDRFIKEKRLLRGVVPQDLKRDLIETLTQGAQGMFRWVSLQLQHLCNPRRMKKAADVRSELGRLPKELADIYAKIYEQVEEGGDRPFAETALRWLLCSKAPLSTADLLSVVFTDTTEDSPPADVETLLEICCNLLVLDDVLHTFRFAHLSVREYLETRPEYVQIELHKLVAEICLSLLVKAGPSRAALKDKTTPPGGSLHEYAVLYWPVHCQLSGVNRAKGVLRNKFASFVLKSEVTPAFTKWMEEAKMAARSLSYEDAPLRGKLKDCFCSPPNAFFLACAFNLPEVIRNGAVLPPGKNEEGLAGLHIAAKYGCPEIARLLLDRGVNVEERDGYGRIALYYAVSGGFAEVVEILLSSHRDFHVDVSMIGVALERSYQRPPPMKALQLLFEADRDFQVTEEVVRLAATAQGKELMAYLLDLDERVGISDDTFWVAVRESGIELVKFLLERDSERPITEDLLVAAIGSAREGGGVLKILLDHYPGPRIGRKVIEVAASTFTKDCMEILLTYDAEIEITEALLTRAIQNYWCARDMTELLLAQNAELRITHDMLVSAAGNDGAQGLELLELLLSRDQSIQITDAMIKGAAGGGSKRMMELLLLRNRNTEITEEFFEAAAYNRQGAEVIPILLEYNGQIRLSEKVVKLAARRNCKKAVEMLLARAADVRAAELLLGAAKNTEHSLEITDFLLTQDERPVITEEVLKAAAGNMACAKDLIDLLLTYDRGAPLTEKVAIAAARHAWGRDTLAYLLHRDPKLPITEEVWKAAAANTISGEDVVEFLLERGSDVYVTEAVLEAAARNGCCSTVELLLQHSSTRTSSSTDWTSVAEFMANCGAHGRISELQRLLAAGVDPEKKDDEGRTPLAVACFWGREDLVKLLLESGKVDIESRNEYGETPLFFAEAALDGRCEAVVRLLLEAGANPDARNVYGCTRLEMTDEDRDRINRS